MYANSGALQSYGEAARTVSAGRQVVMLYDGILGCLREARAAIEDGRIADRFNALKKACDIVHGLSSCIDFANGGEVAPRLEKFYNYVYFRMQRVNFDASVQIVDELIANVTEMRNSWAEIAEQPDAAAPARGAPTEPASPAAGSLTVSA